MKKILLMMAIAALGLGACDERPKPLTIDNALTAEEIAAHMSVSVSTIKRHQARIRQKLGVKNRQELAAYMLA